jgi:hypothetical protein
MDDGRKICWNGLTRGVFSQISALPREANMLSVSLAEYTSLAHQLYLPEIFYIRKMRLVCALIALVSSSSNSLL